MAKDSYHYFRIEARELLTGLTRGLLDIEKSGPIADTVAVLLRLAHTLKGAARVVKQTEISKHAHALEELLTPYRGTHEVVNRDHVSAMLGHVDAMTALAGMLGTGTSEGIGVTLEQSREAAPTQVPRRAGSAAPDELLESVRIDQAHLSGLQKHIHVASIQVAGLMQHVRELKSTMQFDGSTDGEGARIFSVATSPRSKKLNVSASPVQDSLTKGLERVSAELAEITTMVDQLRLRPARSIFELLERAVRDAAQLEHKNVQFETKGGESRLDAHILMALRDVLIHVVRNAVAHGIEPEAQRVASGKQPIGTIQVNVQRRGNRIAFVCHDDGKGIDLVAIRKMGVTQGLFSAQHAATLNTEQTIALILNGGLSTTTSATEVSGRGIGLDIVRSTIARLKGSLDVRTVQGIETRVEMCVPVSLASVTALRLEACGTTACIPFDGVRKSARIRESELVSSNNGMFFMHNDRAIPYITLAEVLQLPSSKRDSRKRISAIVLESDAGLAVLGAERLHSTASVLVQTLPAWVDAHDTVLGAFLNENGAPEVLLDTNVIIKQANSRRTAHAEAPPAAHHILVIDDSLTTRMLEQSILESAGFRVDLASSAEDGLVKAREQKYALFLVDVEMPGMSGFEFIEHIRTQPDLCAIPCILVTSRNEPEDHARGKRAGAQAYIVKNEFNQDFLLQTIRGLVD
jgi:two-component system chemotaxis sensor kinase CheA